MDGHDLALIGQQRLVHLDEVRKRRLRRWRKLLCPAELVEERAVVGDVGLTLCSVGTEVDVERDETDLVCLDDVARQIRRCVGDDGYGGHPSAEPIGPAWTP